VKQLSSVELKDLETATVDIDEVAINLAPQFSTTFSTLLDVRAIEEKKKQAKAEKEARQALSQLSITSSTTQVLKGINECVATKSAPETPDRPTLASNPNFTRSTVESGTSLQSKDEESTKVLANTFIRESMALLGAPFREIRWQQSGHKVQLTDRIVLLEDAEMRRYRDDMKFQLGVESIRAISDGGLGIQYNAGDGWTNFQPGGTRPVLAVEVRLPIAILIIGKTTFAR